MAPKHWTTVHPSVHWIGKLPLLFTRIVVKWSSPIWRTFGSHLLRASLVEHWFIRVIFSPVSIPTIVLPLIQPTCHRFISATTLNTRVNRPRLAWKPNCSRRKHPSVRRGKRNTRRISPPTIDFFLSNDHLLEEIILDWSSSLGVRFVFIVCFLDV